MPERNHRTETLRAGVPLAIGGVTLLPIERVVMHADHGNIGAWFSAAKEPYAIVVRDADGICAFDANATRVSIEQLRDTIPDLDTVLASM
jgi:hypothetical protein